MLRTMRTLRVRSTLAVLLLLLAWPLRAEHLSPAEVAKILYAGLDRDPANRPLPREVAEALEPALDRQPPVRLGGFKVS